MASKIEELTVAYEEDGVQIIKELDKRVLSDGAWATVMYKYQQFDREKQVYGADAYTIRRYKKRNGEYFQQSKFNISSKAQAEKIIETLQQWIKS